MRPTPIRFLWILGMAMGSLLIVGFPAARAGDDAGGLPGFRTPSNNVHCMYDDASLSDGQYKPYIRCDIQTIEGAKPKPPSDCDGEYGRAFNISKDADTGELICVGDAVFDTSYPVLAYGQTFQMGGFTCLSEESGVSCFNAKRHGFTLSRAARKLF